MPKLGVKKKKKETPMFKNKKDRERFTKRNMHDVLDDFFKSTTYRDRFTK